MNTEEKRLLIKELSKNLHYCDKVEAEGLDYPLAVLSIGYNSEKDIVSMIAYDGFKIQTLNIHGKVLPYLYPLSSMTYEQKEELKELCDCDDVDKDGITYNEEGTAEVCWTKVSFKGCSEVVDWLNRNHFDYLGLIGRKLALDATGLGIY